MRIIVDGNDGVGKTSLAKKLQNDLKIKSFIHLSYIDPTNFMFYSKILEKKDVIFDRSFIDEPIYSKIFKRKLKLNKFFRFLLFKKLKKLNYTVIICYTEHKKLKLNEHEEVKKYEKLIDKYFESIAKKYNFIYFDPFNDDYEDLKRRIF